MAFALHAGGPLRAGQLMVLEPALVLLLGLAVGRSCALVGIERPTLIGTSSGR